MLIKKTYKPGEVIVRENTLGNSAYIIEKGRVEVSKNIGRQKIVFTTLETGSIFGEMSLIDNSPRSATVSAIEDTTASVLSKAGFQAMLKQHKPLQSVFGVLAERLRETDQKVNPLKLTNFYFSLCSLVYHLARSTGHRIEEQIAVAMDSLLEESCTILAIQKELVEQVLNRLAFTRLVRIDNSFVGGLEYRDLVIPDERKFRDWLLFLRASSSNDEPGQESESQEQLEASCRVLKVLRDNSAEYDPDKGKTSVGYDNYLNNVENMLNIGHDQADKVLKPYFSSGLFKLTFDKQSNTRRLTCSDPATLDRQINRLDELESYHKMAELLKAMASN